jgi:hypothetical protein
MRTIVALCVALMTMPAAAGPEMHMHEFPELKNCTVVQPLYGQRGELKAVEISCPQGDGRNFDTYVRQYDETGESWPNSLWRFVVEHDPVLCPDRKVHLSSPRPTPFDHGDRLATCVLKNVRLQPPPKKSAKK